MQTSENTPETITQIATDELHESPFNPRKTFTGIEELAATITAEGRIHQPLLVRPRLTNRLRDDLADGYEIVFGHRRYRAAQLAGLATVPCMVRAMTDAEARSAQTVENLQRVDVHPIEEAEGFQALIDNDGHTAESLRDKFGKSLSYVYGRLKLLQACAPVRAACLAGEIGSEVALLIARLRTDKLQQKALNDISGKFIDLRDGGKKSFRQIRDLLNERYALTLARPYIFDPEDAALVPEAGACTTCPKLSANAPEFADVSAGNAEPGRGYTGHLRHTGSNVCTDPDCFATKKAAQFDRQAQALREEGHEVVAGNRARAALTATGEVKGAFVALDQVKAALKKAKAKLPTVTIQNPRNGKTVQAVRTADLQAAGITTAPPAAKASRSSQDYEAAERQRAAEVTAENVKRRALLVRVRLAATNRARSTDELRLVVQHLLHQVNEDDLEALKSLHDANSLRTLLEQLPTLSADALALLLLDLVLVQDVEVAPWNLYRVPEPLHDLAALYGIDPNEAPEEAAPAPVQASETADPAPTPSTAARAPGKAARGAGAVKYRDPATGCTWSGKGLQPRWLKVALEDGADLADFQTDNGAGAAVAEPAEAGA